MKLLVTGGLGFIGSNFILKLLKESDEFEVVNVDAELHGADRRNLFEIENHEEIWKDLSPKILDSTPWKN